jgi:cyanate permease
MAPMRPRPDLSVTADERLSTAGGPPRLPPAAQLRTSSVRTPSRISYYALLGTSAIGTLSSNIITAPINTIADELRATPSQIVFAVSAFTIAMVVFAPIAGWLCERYGPKRFLLASLTFMVLGQLGASASTDIWSLILMRACQGFACSAIPPAVQQSLGALWTKRRGRVMAAWASAIGAGQAVGPPLGGAIADVFGWRAIFVFHALVTVLMLILLSRVAPLVRAGRPPMHVAGMITLVVGVGSLVCAFTLLGQTPAALPHVLLAVLGCACLALYIGLSRRNPRALVSPRLLVEVRYLRSTAAAATVMAALGVVIVTVPLTLGAEMGMRPGAIGVITFTLAASMTLFAPVSSRIAERLTPRRVLHGGLVMLIVGPPLLAVPSSAASLPHAITGIVASLVLIGCGIGAAQSSAALGVIRSPAAASGSALGIHNMMRFAGLALGYAWVAATYPSGDLFLVYAGPAGMAAATLALTLIGPPASPVDD